MRSITLQLYRLWAAAGEHKFLFIFLAVWVAVVLLAGIPYGDLSGYDDAVYAHEARAMLQSGDIWTLNLNGATDFDKPPLFIWLVALSFKLFGVTDLAAKVPAVLCGWASVMLVYFLVKELYPAEPDDETSGEWLPAAAMLAMATLQYFLKYSSHVMTDVPYTFFYPIAIYFYVRGLKNGLFLLAAGAATGLAELIRSPMGLFPLAVIVLHLAFTRRWRKLMSPYLLGCVGLALAIPAVWYFREYSLFGPVFIDRHLANLAAHSAAAVPLTGWQRFAGLFEYFTLAARQCLPWFPFALFGLYAACRRLISRRGTADALLVIWLLVIVVPFSIAEIKVLRYIMAAFPVMAILSACALIGLISRDRMRLVSCIAVLLLVVVGVMTIVSPRYLMRAEDMRVIGPVSDASTAEGDTVVLYTGGELQYNFANQLFWYGHRHVIHVTDIDEIPRRLAASGPQVVVIDRQSFHRLLEGKLANFAILGRSADFLCIRVRAVQPAPGA